MRHQGLRGFPGFLVKRDGAVERLPHEACYGRAEAFVSLIRQAAPERDRRVSA